jgi:hypothetical protein
MAEPTLPTPPAVDPSTATIDLGYSSRQPVHDDATDVGPHLALFKDEEEEEDSFIVPNRHEEASAGEDRLRAWRELSEERAIARRQEEALLATKRLERHRRAGMAAAVAGLLGVALVANSQLSESPEATASVAPEPALVTETPVPLADLEGAIPAAPVVTNVTPQGLDTTAEIAAEPVPVTHGDFDPQVVDGTLNTWTTNATEWLQFDFKGVSTLEIRWLDATGQQALNPWTCDGYLNRTTRRCYVGRTHDRIGVALASGAIAGT